MWDIWYVRGVVFVVVIFSINSCHNLYICIIYIFEFVVNNYLYIYYFESVSCIQHIVIKPPSKLINFPLKKIIIRIIESLGNFKIFPWRFIYLFKNIYSSIIYKCSFIVGFSMLYLMEIRAEVILLFHLLCL